MTDKALSTRYLAANPIKPEPEIIQEAAALLRRGGLVAFPTETVYGLGANALDEEAVSKIFIAKGRPNDNPLIVHIGRMEEVGKLARDFPPQARKLAEHFWPGPLTLVLPKREEVPDSVTAGLDTVALRLPAHPVALALIQAAGVPVAAPSANRSGRPSPTTAEHVCTDLDGRIDIILDGGPAGVGVESTVVDVTEAIPIVLRPGGITLEQLREVVGPVNMDAAVAGGKEKMDQVPRSPGMKYTHYSPEAPVLLVEGPWPQVAEEILRIAEKEAERGNLVRVLVSTETSCLWGPNPKGVDGIEAVGSRHDLRTVAAGLFAGLRRCDLGKPHLIIAEGFPVTGVGLAVMNRLRKAAGRILRLENA